MCIQLRAGELFVAEHKGRFAERADELLESFDEIVEELCFLSVKKKSSLNGSII